MSYSLPCTATHSFLHAASSCFSSKCSWCKMLKCPQRPRQNQLQKNCFGLHNSTLNIVFRYVKEKNVVNCVHFSHTLLLSSLASSALFKVMLNPFPEGLGKLEVERTCQVGGNFWLTAWAGRVPPAIAIFECAKDPASPKVTLLESRVVKNCFEIEVFSKFPSSFWRRSYLKKRTWQVGMRFTKAANL